jgi:hypothetical protein
MGSTITVRCVACGHENNAQYRYCGMCGAALLREPAAVRPALSPAAPKPATPVPAPPRAAAPGPVSAKPVPPKPAPASAVPPARKTPPLEVGGYSILGLEEEPDRRVPGREAESRQEASHSVAYLLEDDEDEPKSHRWRTYLALALLLIAAGVLLEQWQRHGYPQAVVSLISAVRNRIAPVASTPSSEASPQSQTAEAASETGPSPESVSDKPSPEKSAVVPPGNEPATSSNPTPAPVEAPAVPDDQSAVQAAAPEIAPATPAATAPPAPQASSPNAAAAAPSSLASHTPAPQTAKPAESAAPATPAEPAATESKAAPAVRRPASSPVSTADRLVADGTKYLYGDGVEQNCDLAEKNLRRAAASSAEAEGLLGTMYASGHCVARDLPTAYRWYARALHRDPSNKRYQSDLVALWNQMTPAERRLIAGK